MYQVYHNNKPVRSQFYITRNLAVETSPGLTLALYATYNQAWTHIWEAQGQPVEAALEDGWSIEETK